MSGAAMLLWIVAAIYGFALVLFLAHWFTQGIRFIESERRRDRRRDLPRVRARINL